MPGRLLGYTKTLVPITDPVRAAIHGTMHDANIVRTQDAHSEVSGVVVEPTDRELARADLYESDDGCVRVRVSTATGRRVWVYVSKS